MQELACRRPGFDSGVGEIPWRRRWQPTPVLLPGKSHGQRSLVGYSPWGCGKESGMTEWLSTHVHVHACAHAHTHTHTRMVSGIMICFHVCSLFPEKILIYVEIAYVCAGIWKFGKSINPSFLLQAKFSHRCETQISVLINGYRWSVIKAQPVG